MMDLNEYSDLILRTLLEKHGVDTWPDGLTFINSIEKGDSSIALKLLKELDYIDKTTGVEWVISLKSKGAYFIQNGGFSGKVEYDNKMLENAVVSKNVTIGALIVAVLSLIVAIVTLLKQ